MGRRKAKILVFATIMTTLVYIVWRIFYTLPWSYGRVSICFGLFLLFAEVMGMAEQMFHFYSMSDIKKAEKPSADPKDYPTVDVFIATYNEPAELLYKTVNGCVNMDYPDKDKVRIYLCDDGGREEIKQLADHFKIGYFARTDHEGAKAGNLNYALQHSNGDLVVTFDADMIPMSDFLMETVPYFVKDLSEAKRLEREAGIEARKERKGKVGFIQTPQSFYNLDLFQYNLFSEERIPNEQDYFYRDIQLAKNKVNSVIYGGSNTVLSREALEAIGGFVTNVITEDFATGMLIQSNGYECFAIDEVHASGLSPEDLENLVKQRRRWARGCIQTNRKLNILFRKGLNMKQKISYLFSIGYWYDSLKRLIYYVAPIAYGVFGIRIVVANPLCVLLIWLPMYVINCVTLKYLSGNIRTVRWTNIYETILFPMLIGDVILEMFGISKQVFSVTDKGQRKEDGNYQRRMAIPHIVFASLTLFGMIRSVYIVFSTGSIQILFLLFWLSVNFYHLIMALFFMNGRKVNRKNERFGIPVEGVICLGTKEHAFVTKDISEGGFCFILNSPEYIDPDQPHSVQLKTDRYYTDCKAKIVQVSEEENGWRYAFQIVEIKEEDYKQLLHILHDRVPPLTKEIQTDLGVVEDIRINIQKRRQHLRNFTRKLPRIDMNHPVKDSNGMVYQLKSFNHRYLALKVPDKNNVQEMVCLCLENGMQISLCLERSLSDQKHREEDSLYLYRFNELLQGEEQMLIVNLFLQYGKAYKTKIREQNRREKEEEFDELAYL
ncbi:MAG: glycosyltransferase [Lachnospiraceae bacterium]|nr:glycosyltransferase [Lachnospiraceae bacterium]